MNPSPIHFTIVYGVTFFLSFFLFIPASINNHRMDGNCLLSAAGHWNATTSELIVTWGRRSDCNFVLFMGIACVLASVYFLVRSINFVRKGYEGSPLFCFVSLLFGIFMTISLLSSSFIISIGYSSWCDIVMEKPGNTDVCWKVGLGKFDKTYGVNTDDFSTDLEVSEFGSWSSSLAWLAATILSFFKVRYYHKNEELLQNLAFEKDSLIPYRTRYQNIDDGESSLT